MRQVNPSKSNLALPKKTSHVNTACCCSARKTSTISGVDSGGPPHKTHLRDTATRHGSDILQVVMEAVDSKSTRRAQKATPQYLLFCPILSRSNAYEALSLPSAHLLDLTVVHKDVRCITA
jgi:hypothetical protein